MSRKGFYFDHPLRSEMINRWIERTLKMMGKNPKYPDNIEAIRTLCESMPYKVIIAPLIFDDYKTSNRRGLCLRNRYGITKMELDTIRATFRRSGHNFRGSN